MNITIMKLRIKLVMLWSVFIASAVGLSSCSDFLTEDSQTAISEDKMFSDLEYTETNLKAIYTSWRNTFKDRYLWEMMVGTDEIQSGAFQALKSGMERGALDAYDANLNSENSYTSEQWTMRWPIVSAAAKIVKVLQEGDDLVVGEKRSQIYGEACFIRGSLEMELAMYWGEVPIIDLARIDDLGYGRQPLKDVWAFIINDLQEAVKYCPETNDPGRATTSMLVHKPLSLRFRPRELSFVIDYRTEQDETHLSYIRNVMRFNCDWKRKLFSSPFTVISEFVVTDRQEEAIRPIRGRDSFSRRDKLYDKVEYFNDPNFWGADNIIEPTESLDKAIERLKLRVKRQRN